MCEECPIGLSLFLCTRSLKRGIFPIIFGQLLLEGRAGKVKQDVYSSWPKLPDFWLPRASRSVHCRLGRVVRKWGRGTIFPPTHVLGAPYCQGWSNDMTKLGKCFSTALLVFTEFIEPTCAYCTVGSYALLSVRLSVRPSVTLLKIHISESIKGRNLKRYHSIKPS